MAAFKIREWAMGRGLDPSLDHYRLNEDFVMFTSPNHVLFRFLSALGVHYQIQIPYSFCQMAISIPV